MKSIKRVLAFAITFSLLLANIHPRALATELHSQTKISKQEISIKNDENGELGVIVHLPEDHE